MGSEMIGAVGLGMLLVLMVLRVPVALTMLIIGVVGFAQVISWGRQFRSLKPSRWKCYQVTVSARFPCLF